MTSPRLLAAVALATSVACAAPPPSPDSQPEGPQGPQSPGSGLLFTRAELETPEGATAMEFVVKSDSVNLYDEEDEKIGTYRVDGEGRIAFVAERVRRSGELTRGEEGFAMRTGDGPVLLLSGEPDGDLLLHREGELLLDIKRRDYGYKVVDTQGNDLGRVRIGSNKIKVRNANRVDVRETKAPMSTAAVACWLLPFIEPHEAGGFALAVTLWGLPN